jgi:hypothetical protein
LKERYKRPKYEEEDVSSYWTTIRERKYTGIWNRKQ